MSNTRTRRDEIFQTLIHDALRCAICLEILEDPVQCVSNEHHFCRPCIVKHLKHFSICPSCKDPLTASTLRRPQRFLADALDGLKATATSMDALECVADGKNKEEAKEILLLKAEMSKLRLKQQEMFAMMKEMVSCNKMICNQRFSPPLLTRSQIVVAGGGSRSPEVFDVATRTWRMKPDMSRHRKGASSVLFQGHMIVVGGKGVQSGLRGDYSDSIETLDLQQQDATWISSQIHLPAACSGHACVVQGDSLLVSGGHSGNMIHKVNDKVHEILLTTPSTIRVLTCLPHPLYHHGAAMIDGKLYVVGGQQGVSYNDVTSDVHVFDPVTSTWTSMQPLCYAVTQMGVTTWMDNLIILGGKAKQKGTILDKVLMYNVTTGCTSMLPSMMKQRYGCAAVTIGDNVFAIGGLGNGCEYDYLKSVEYFNFTSNVWTELPAMNIGRFMATAVAL